MANKSQSKPSETNMEVLMMGYLCVKGIDTLVEKVSILDRFGLADNDIATICNCAIQSVRNARLQPPKKAKSTLGEKNV